MAYTLNVKKLVDDVRGQKGLTALTDEAEKITAEIKRLEQTYKPQAKEQIKKLESGYHDLVKRVQRAQKDLDKELKTTLTVVKSAAQDAEKRLLQEKNRLVAHFTKKKAGPRKTTTAAKKTTARKTAKRRSKSSK